jgi:hypothetical protein
MPLLLAEGVKGSGPLGHFHRHAFIDKIEVLPVKEMATALSILSTVAANRDSDNAMNLRSLFRY